MNKIFISDNSDLHTQQQGTEISVPSSADNNNFSSLINSNFVFIISSLLILLIITIILIFKKQNSKQKKAVKQFDVNKAIKNRNKNKKKESNPVNNLETPATLKDCIKAFLEKTK